ncbi:hypothetical protein DBV39_03240 [Orrella marina]|uniref:Uncharacterized protein n=1 Tax=Orrella marina TaxID=2163011 RepID=A0A2R4XGS6_9BURK|nr:hypothetical protein DBV39_03240 [Orrella marina]
MRVMIVHHTFYSFPLFYQHLLARCRHNSRSHQSAQSATINLAREPMAARSVATGQAQPLETPLEMYRRFSIELTLDA